MSANPFVVGHLMGQLGNQFFITAATMSLAWDNQATASFPGFFEVAEPVFKLPLNYEKVFYRLDTTKPRIDYTYYETTFTYSPIEYRPNMRLVGWFQSEKYFKHHKEKIIELFSPSEEIVSYLHSKYSDIIKHPKTVSIHFRSYKVENSEVQKAYVSPGMDYYEKAIELFPEDSLFVVFSNDIEWCKEAFAHIPRQFRFIEGELHYHDLYLMSLCKHQIICNSSFSWWAAYLNTNPDKRVIVPPVWFSESYSVDHDTRDLIPEEWQILK
jgi:hypothetical protein